MMKRQLMTKKRQDGSTSTVMYSAIQKTNLYLLLLWVLGLNYSLCKSICLFSLIQICLVLEKSSFVYLYFCLLIWHRPSVWLNIQDNFHFPTCTCWCILSLQSRGSIHCSSCHLCSYIRDCWVHCDILLLSVRRKQLGMCAIFLNMLTFFVSYVFQNCCIVI